MYLLTERAHLRSPSMNVMKFSILNKFDNKNFNNSLKKLYSIHPLLSSTVKYNPQDNNYYYVPNTIDKINYKIINPPYNVDNLIINNFIKNQLSVPFIFEKEGLLRIFIFENEKDFQVLFFAHRLLGDGTSLKILVKDFLDLYDGNNIENTKNTRLIKNISDFQSNFKLPFSTKFYIGLLNSYWKINKKTFSNEDYYRMFNNYYQKHYPEITTLTFDKNETNNIINNCKKHSITINSALCSAFLSAISNLDNQNFSYKICTSINIRKNLNFNASECLGNFASAITIDYKYNKDTSFWENSSLIYNLINQKLNNSNEKYLCINLYLNLDPNLIDSSYFYAFDKFKNIASKKVFNMFYPSNQITTINLGNLNISNDYKNFSVKDIIFIPPIFNNKIIGISTFNNQLSITLCYQKTTLHKNNLSNKILSKMKYLLCN